MNVATHTPDILDSMRHVGRAARMREGGDRTPSSLRYAEQYAWMSLSRAYSDLSDVDPSDTDGIYNARRRVSRWTAYWVAASDALEAAPKEPARQ